MPILLVVAVFTACSENDDSSPVVDNPNPQPDTIYKIGDTGPGGGVIFYLTSENHGYEMAGRIGTAKWQDIVELTDATNVAGLGTAIGTGKQNTTIIVTALGSGNYAAKMSNDYVQGGFDDWFLPSRDELKEMYNYFHTCHCITGIDPVNYWSSSQGENIWVTWVTNFRVNIDTTQFENWTYPLQKNQTVSVKPIRQF